MARHKDGRWSLPETGIGWEHVNVAVLMDIRDELQRLNSLLYCHNFTGIPETLRGIKRNTMKPRRRKRKPA